MEDIKLYLRERGVRLGLLEGSASPAELEYLGKLAQKIRAKHIVEIGFNAGFSARAFLAARPEATVTSFDIGDHSYTKLAKQYIDQQFPGRHELIIGDSRLTVPAYAVKVKFDLAFVDGGHAYKVAKADLENMRRLCEPEAAVVMDDLVPWLQWGVGPFLAWRSMIKRGQIRQSELYQDGRKVERLRFPAHRVWALGFYEQKRL